MFETTWQDIRHAARTLRVRPVFTLTAVLSLAIGIAGTAAIFGIVDTYFLRPWPGIADPTRLVEVGRTDSGQGSGPYSGDGFDTFSYPNYLDYRERQTVFEGLAAHDERTFGLGADASAVRVQGGYVSANYFAVLGVPIALGRGFLPEEEQAASPNAVAVISDRLWRTQFSSDRGVIGRTIRLNGRPFTIIGVTGPGFNGHTLERESLWTPITAYPDGDDLRRFTRRGQQWLMGLGRLKDGVSIAQARAEMARIGRALEREYPNDNGRHGLTVEPSGAVPVVGRSTVGRFIALLFALVGLILMVACTNVGAMLLARGVSRTRELALRLALGAERQRIIRLLVIESLVVASAGAAVGLLGAWGAIRLVEQLIPILRIGVTYDVHIDWRVMAFSIVVAAATGIACGLVPAMQATRIDLSSAMKPDSAGGPRRLRARQGLLVAQVALSVLLVVCALLLGRSLRNANTIDPGFVADGVEVAGLEVASAFVVPLTMEAEGGRAWLPEERGDERAINANWNFVTADYFRVLQIPLLRGRAFDASDRIGAPAVAIVNETLARRAWPRQDPVGQRLVVGVSRRPLQIVGVARDTKYRTIGEEPRPFIYGPATQRYENQMWLLLQSNGPSALPQVRALVAELNPNLPLVRASTLTEMTAIGLLPHRLASWLAGSVATIGIFLAAIGIYGLTAYNVSQRTREIGVRVALGATASQVMNRVMGGAVLLAGVGAGLGLVAAALVTNLLGGMLYGVRPLDPVSFAGGASVFVAVALIASLFPARRAASVNPVEALRAE